MRLAAKAALALAAAGVGAVTVATQSGDDGGQRAERPAGCPSFADRWDHRADPPRDTVIGRVGWYGLPSALRDRRGLAPQEGVRAIRAPTIVRAGPAVTVLVPRRQRSWMWLDYTGERTHVVELRPCRRGLTHWWGRVVVDHARAPNRGRCARLAVRSTGDARPRSGFAFAPPRGFCEARGRDVVLGSPDHVRSLGEGWGSPRPRRISNGGSPGGLLTHVRWEGWGGRTARGRGTGYELGRGGYDPVPIRLEAVRRGRCRGYEPLAYRVLRVRFPGEAWFKWNLGRSLCGPRSLR
jgi:hypothetical protein